MKKLIAATAFTLMCGSAFAQTTGAPAAAQNDMNKPGMNNPDRGSMNQGTTGASTMPSPRGDASTSGAPTSAPVNNTGTLTEPGAVKDGVNRR
jgi:uncharacterized protein YdeI (BOF family)